MRFATESAQTTRCVDRSDIRTDSLQKSKGATFGVDFAKDVVANTVSEIRSCSGEPLSSFLDEVLRDAVGFVVQAGFGVAGVVESGDGFVDLFAADAGTGF